MFVWKKCREKVLVKLRVPIEAARSNATNRKCRVEFAYVVEVIGAEFGVSIHQSSFTYRVGEKVVPSDWNTDRWVECSGGIHCFLTREEAELYE